MEEYILPSRIANKIMMDDSVKCFIVIEGKSDLRFYKNIISKSNVVLIYANGSHNVCQVLEVLKKEKHCINNYLAIIDRDFHEILNTFPEYDNLLFTDLHDIEIMMLKSAAFDKVINMYAGDKQQQIEQQYSKTIRNIIANITTEIGYLRLANYTETLGLTFKPKDVNGKHIDHNKFIDNDFQAVHIDNMITTIVNYSKNKSNPKSQIDVKQAYEKCKKVKYDSNQLSNGHDACHIIYLFLKKIIKLSSKEIIDSKMIENSLILAYSMNDFRNTKLYNNLQQWANNNNKTLFDS